MQPIIATINPGETGAQVTNLQDALLAVLERGRIRALTPPNRPSATELQRLAEGLKQDRVALVFGDATAQIITYFQLQEGLGDHLRGVVEDTTAAKLNDVLRSLGLLDSTDSNGCVVLGHVTGARSGYLVRAYDRDFRSEEILGESAIDAQGRYEISYTAEQFKRAEKGQADLRIAVCEAGGRELVSSEIVFNAGPRVEVDLVVTFGAETPAQSEYERHVADLGAVLQGETLIKVASGKPEDVEKDLTFLAGDTGIDRQHLVWLLKASLLAQEVLPPINPGPMTHVPIRVGVPGPDGIPPEAFYGWLRQALPAEWAALSAVRIGTLCSTLTEAVEKNIIPAWVRAQIDGILNLVPNPERRDLSGLLGVSALPADTTRTILNALDGIDAVSHDVLTGLVEKQTLAPHEAERLGLTVSLHRLAGPVPALVTTMVDAEFASLKGGKLKHARDLATLEPDEWEDALKSAGSPIPDGLSRPAFARSLAIDAAKAYPEHAFRQRAGRAPSGLNEKLQRLQPLLDRNRNALALDFNEIDVAHIPAGERQSVHEAHTALRNLANVHPGLGLHEALSRAAGSVEATKVVAERLGWIETVFEKNPTVSFLDLDYLPGGLELSTVDFGALPEGARERVLADFKAQQRIHAVTDNTIPAQEIMKAGFHSASAIALTSEADFSDKSGLSAPEARAYRAKASGRANQAAIDWFSIYEATRDEFTTPVRVIPSRQHFFKPLEGFAKLLNDQPWCACQECQSVLSPAAYFVDLMYYIETNVLDGSFKGQANHTLHLRKRRPDLWELPLTCENTNDFVPSLDLVNEILETYLKEVVPLGSGAAVYTHLALQDGSFNQPITLPMERLEILLGHFGLSRHDVAKAMHAESGVRVRARLSMSLVEYALITTERHADPAFLRRLFRLGTGGNVTAPDVVLAPMEMAALLNATGLTHEAAEAVLKTTFAGVDGSTTAAIEVVLGKRDPQDVQNNSEVVKNLTLRRLDRIHRFVRLWRKLPWTIEELDYVLGRFAAPAQTARIDPQTAAGKGTLERILDLLDLNADWSLSVEELIALTDAFPTRPFREPVSLFDRLFNHPGFVSRDGQWPLQAAGRWTHPAWQRRGTGGPIPSTGASTPSDNTLTRLLAGLHLTDAEFVQLVAGLGSFGAVDHQGATSTRDESISLSRESIGALYRHARLRSLLGRTVTDFIKILTLAPIPRAVPADPAGYVVSLNDVRKVAEFSAWQKTSGFSLDEIASLIDPAAPAAMADAAKRAAGIVASVKSEKTLEFADTIFTQIGLTELQSRETVLANLSVANGDPGPIEMLPDGLSYQLRAGVVTPITAMATAPVNAAALSNLFKKYDALQVLDVALGSALNLSPDAVTILRKLAYPLAAADVAMVTRAVQGRVDAADLDRLTKLIAATMRFHSLFKSTVFGIDGLTFVRDHSDIFFGPATVPPKLVITTAVIRNVSAYVGLASATDTGFTTASSPVDLGAIQRAVAGVGAASDADLAKTLRTDEARIGALKPHLHSLPTNPFDALSVMAGCLVLIKQLGVSGETLELMVTESTPAETFNRLSRAAEDVFGAFRTKYPKEQTFKEKLEPYEDKLRARKRDGLVDYIVTRWPVPFSDPSKLYEYFLVDVMIEGCARTSRLVSAISSLQLYVHRVLMNLERSLDWDGQIPPKAGVYARFTESDPPLPETKKRLEWQWRQQYRVWEANRKVFLYPENYIEPELRDDKTPLFEELEDTLLVQEIDKSSIHDAYSRYLAGFDELAHLKIAGAYYHQATKTLHLFGVTQDDAPVYYYRAVDESESTKADPAPVFSAWQKTNLQIPVRKVSPIVVGGRLHVFWVETATRPINAFANGAATFGGYRHTVRVKYSLLRLDGVWSSPQVMNFVENGGTGDSRIIEDPLDTTVVDNLKAIVATMRAALAKKEGEEPDAIKKSNKANTDWMVAKADRIVKEARFQGGITLVEAGLIVAGLALGIPPLVTLAGVRTFEYNEWRIAVLVENEKNEARLLAEDELAALRRSIHLQLEDIARRESEIDETQVYVRWDSSWRNHKQALDSYRPEGWAWDRVYPDVHGAGIRLMLVPRNSPFLLPDGKPAFSQAAPVPVLGKSGDFDPNPSVLREMAGTEQPAHAAATGTNWVSGQVQSLPSPPIDSATYPGQQFYAATFWLNRGLLAGSGLVAAAPATSDIQCVNGESTSLIIESQGDSAWMRNSSGSYAGMRLSTGLTPTLIDQFWIDGANSFLDAGFQESLVEVRSKISPVAGQSDSKRSDPFHPENPCLTYFREAFFHIPFLVANHLNSQQDFEKTQSWYHYIFDPTAAVGDPWRYREFRDPDKLTTSLREMLTNSKALAAYRKDPFNPHAIARTRLSAYQKSIVMKYIDNLLDWADSLFSQFTMESINEATMLYVMAQDILGPRPQVLGSCGEGKVSPKNYANIRAGLTDISPFLIELEAPSSRKPFVADGRVADKLVVETRSSNAQASTMASAPGAPAGAPPVVGLVGAGGSVQSPLAIRDMRKDRGTIWSSDGGTSLATVRENTLAPTGGIKTILGSGPVAPPIPPGKGGAIDFVNPASGFAGGHVGVRGGGTVAPFGELAGKHGVGFLDVTHDLHDGGQMLPVEIAPGFTKFEYEPVAMVPPKDAVFCIPPNKDLLAYWGRVEGRLRNIRNCMDISGVRRSPELFAPEIDPRLLVRMKAAGLSLEDVLNSTSGNLPPYRFTYLIEKAKQYAGTVQSFGAQLLSALEKRDGEELSHLRAVHEQNLLKMRRKMTQLEITAAEDTLEGLRLQKGAVEYRRDHFKLLYEGGQISQERKQQQLQREAAGYRTAAGIAQVVASILTIIPDVGAPTSMKFGGSQLGASGRAVAEGLNALAAFNEMGASMAGVEASNQRRDQEWQHQVETARREITQIEKNMTAAEIRRDIAVQSFEVHEQTIAQTEEIFDFFREKFSSVDRYRLLSTDLRRLYRLAFNAALTMAKMAEQAYRAERTEDDAMLGATYWDADSAGLLAGERLLVDLQRLERQFIEGNYRQLEIEHSFSLAQFAPDELAALRLTGECQFKVPEWFFDMTYPGQYRRRLKAVRLTIPCVTGPYANVGATLRLIDSEIRLTLPQQPADPLGATKKVPLRHTVSMATSKAQNDSGVFDFNFRDERYMPFEGAGAIGTWKVMLPKTVRVFDYATISDVILHLSYTADYAEQLKERWDGTAQKLIGLLKANGPDGEPLMTRLFSLRTEFPDVFHRLVTSAIDKKVEFRIDTGHFPIFAGGRIEASTASLRVISSLKNLQGATLAIGRKAINQDPQTYKQADASAQPDLTSGTRNEFDCGDVFQETPNGPGLSPALVGNYVIKIVTAGPLAPAQPGAGAVDPTELHDIVLRVGYRLA